MPVLVITFWVSLSAQAWHHAAHITGFFRSHREKIRGNIGQKIRWTIFYLDHFYLWPPFLPYRLCVRLCVCHKLINFSTAECIELVFGTETAYPTLCYNDQIQVELSPKIRVFPSGTFPKLWTYKNFAMARRPVVQMLSQA